MNDTPFLHGKSSDIPAQLELISDLVTTDKEQDEFPETVYDCGEKELKMKGKGLVKAHMFITVNREGTWIRYDETVTDRDGKPLSIVRHWGLYGTATATTPALNAAIRPIEFLTVETSTGEKKEYLRVEFVTNAGEVVRKRIPSSALTSPGNSKQEWQSIREAGFRVTDTDMQWLGRIQMEILNAAKPTMPKIQGWETGGWACGRGGECEHIAPGHDLYAGPIQGGFIRTAGKQELWFNSVRYLLEQSPIAGICLGWACAGFLRWWITLDANPILNLWSNKGGKGKSLVLELAASFAGEPLGGLLANGSSTAAGTRGAMAKVNHMFICLDDWQAMANGRAEREPINVLMPQLNPAPRSIGSQGGGVKEQGKYDIMVLASANTDFGSLQRNHSQYDAFNSRVVEINAMDYPIWPSNWTEKEINAIRPILRENYGWGYPLLIETIKDKAEYYQEIYKETESDISGLGLSRKVGYFAIWRAGIELLCDILRINSKPLENTFWEIVKRETQAKQTNDETSAAGEKLFSMVSSNLGRFKFRPKSMIYTESKPGIDDDKAQKDAALFHNEKVSGSGRSQWGWIVQESWMEEPNMYSGWFHISTSAVDTIQQETGLSIPAIAEEARQQGWLKHDTGKLTRKAFSGDTSKYYSFNIGAFNRHCVFNWLAGKHEIIKSVLENEGEFNKETYKKVRTELYYSTMNEETAPEPQIITVDLIEEYLNRYFPAA